jgi:hypothetical protein
VIDEKKLIILVQGHECLYNLQHKAYGNSLVKDSSWKEIAGELHAQDKKLSQNSTVGEWQGSGRVVAGEWHGNGMVCVNRSLKRQRNSRGTAWEQHGNGMVCVNPPLWFYPRIRLEGISQRKMSFTVGGFLVE